MPDNSTRVHKAYPSELQKAQESYLSYARVGQPVEKLSETQSTNEIAAVNSLLHVTMPHFLEDAVLVEFEKVRNQFSAKIDSNVIKRSSEDSPKVTGKRFLKTLCDLQLTLSSLLSSHKISSALIKAILLDVDQLTDEQQLHTFFEKTKHKLTQACLQMRRHATAVDVERQIQINGKVIINTYNNDPSVVLQVFEEQLGQEKVNPEVINFLLDYLNQKHLVKGLNFLEDALNLNFLDVDPKRQIIFVYPALKQNIVTEPDGSVKVILERTFEEFIKQALYERSREKIPGPVQAKTYLQFHIQTQKDNNTTSHPHIKIDILNGYLEIYNDYLRRKYLEARIDRITDSIRQNKHLAANDKLVIKLFLQELKDDNGTLKFKKIKANHLFLLMWDDLVSLEKIILNPTSLYYSFYKRPAQEIIADLEIIKQKFCVSNTVLSGSVLEIINRLNDLFRLLEDKNIPAIAQAIKMTRAEVLSVLLSVQDIVFANQLIESLDVKHRLDSELLTHFALLDESIAKQVLNPTTLEKLSFIIKNRSVTQNRQLSNDRLLPAHLKAILGKYPQFWDTFFAPRKKNSLLSDPNFRDQLEACDLKDLIDGKKLKNNSFRKALYAVASDSELEAKVISEETFNIEEYVSYLEQNNMKDLAQIAADRKRWSLLHKQIPESALFNFYLAKFELEYEHSPTRLISLIEDFWGDTPARKPNTFWVDTIDPNKKPLIRKALLKVIGEKKVQLGMISKDFPPEVPEEVMIGECFIFPNLQGTYHKDYITPKQLYALQAELLDHIEFFRKIVCNPSFKVLVSENKKLFKIVWEIAKQKNLNLTLVDLSLLLANKEQGRGEKLSGGGFAIWLNPKQEECSYLIKKIIDDSDFAKAFLSAHSDETNLLLLRKANFDEFSQLILKYTELGNLQFNSLLTISKEVKDTQYKTNFSNLLKNLDPLVFTLIMTKYPALIKVINCFGLFDEYQGKIFDSLKQVAGIIDPSKVQDIKNEHPLIREQFVANDSRMMDLQVANKRFSTEISELLKSPGHVIAKSIIIEINNNNLEMISSLFDQREIMDKLFNTTNPQVDFLHVAASLHNKNKELLTKYINLLVMKIIIDSRLVEYTLGSSNFRPYLSNACDPNLLAILLAVYPSNLNDWSEGLTRILGQHDIAKRYLPMFAQYPNFGVWLISEIQSGLLFSIDKYNPQLGIDIISYLEKGEFRGSDVIQWLLRQYETDYEIKEKEGEPRLRDLLCNNKIIREKFLIRSRDYPDMMLTVIMNEMEKNKHSVLIDCLLREPFVAHLLENLSSDSLVRFFSFLKDAAFHTYRNDIVDLILRDYLYRDSFAEKLVSCELFSCLLEALEKDTDKKRAFILAILKYPMLPPGLVHFFSKTDISKRDQVGPTHITNLFVDLEDKNEILNYLLTLFKHKEVLKISMEYILEISQMLNFSKTSLFSFFLEEFNPLKLADVLLAFLKLQTSGDSSFSHRNIKEAFAEEGIDDACKLRMLHSASEHTLIDLYVADGLSESEDDVINMDKHFCVRPLIRKEEFNFMNRIYLFSEENKLIELFKSDPSLLDDFAAKLQLEDGLGFALCKRFFSEKASMTNLIRFLLENLNVVLQCHLMSLSNKGIYNAFIRQLDIGLLERLKDKLTFYFDYFIVERSTEELLRILTAFKDYQGSHTLALHMYSLLIARKSLSISHSQEFLLKHLDASTFLSTALARELILQLPIDFLIKLAHYPIADKFIQGSNETELFERFSKTPHLFNAYFFNSSHKLELYLLLNQHNKYPSLHQVMETILSSNQEKACVMLNQASEVDLAAIYNYEHAAQQQGFIKGLPLTDLMFNHPKLLSRLFSVIHLIKDNIVFTPLVRSALVEDQKQGSPFKLASTYYDNFEIIKRAGNSSLGNILQFKRNTKETSTIHKEAYLYTLHLIFASKPLNNKDKVDFRYLSFLECMQELVQFDSDGILRFKDSQEMVKTRYALFYYDAMSHFFYEGRMKESMKEFIARKPAFRKELLKTIEVRKDGVVLLKDIQADIPTYYMHAVLYALAEEMAANPKESIEHQLKARPGLDIAFIKSVDYQQGIIQFERIKGENAKLPVGYYKVICDILARSEDTKDSDKLAMICCLPHKDEWLKKPVVRKNILESIYFENNGIVKFCDTHAQVPEYYLDVIRDLFQQDFLENFDKIQNPNFIILISLIPKYTQLLKNDPKIRIAVLKSVTPIDDNGDIFFKQNRQKIPDFFGVVIMQAIMLSEQVESLEDLLNSLYRKYPNLENTFKKATQAKRSQPQNNSIKSHSVRRSSSQDFGVIGEYPEDVIPDALQEKQQLKESPKMSRTMQLMNKDIRKDHPNTPERSKSATFFGVPRPVKMSFSRKPIPSFGTNDKKEETETLSKKN